MKEIRGILIDDDPKILTSLAEMLKMFFNDNNSRVKVITFESVSEFSEGDLIFPPNFVITDGLLPDGSGDQIFDAVKELWGDIPIILYHGGKFSPRRNYNKIFLKPCRCKEIFNTLWKMLYC